MPYIRKEQRDDIKRHVRDAVENVNNAGELNFTISMVCKEFLRNYGTQYNTINDILGALEGAKLEFYRRVAVDYETEKCRLNGDIY